MQVYNNYKHMMYGAAVRIVKSREEAEDIVQDCFIKGFQKNTSVRKRCESWRMVKTYSD